MPDPSTAPDPLSGVQSGRPGTISFVLGLPDPATFPYAQIQEAAEVALRQAGAVALQYAPEQGYGRLIDCIIDKWRHDEEATIARENVTITFGSTDAVNLLSQHLARPGDVVLVEAPSYRDTLHLFHDHGFRLVQVPIDERGLQIEALRHVLRDLQRQGQPPKFLYTIPSFQNPSGVTLSLDRRRTLIDLAREYDFLIVADDVYRDLVYENGVPPALGALDPAGARVITVGSVSKILAAGLRLGWIIARPPVIEKLYGSGVRAMGGGANPLISHLVAAFCQAGHLEPHIMALRQVYARRRDAMLSALESFMPDTVRWSRPAGGYFIWLQLPPALSSAEVVRVADQDGVTCLASRAFYAGEGANDHIRLAFSYVPPDRIQTGIAKLAAVIDRLSR
jgi:2-aminoadipate transaminase